MDRSVVLLAAVAITFALTACIGQTPQPDSAPAMNAPATATPTPPATEARENGLTVDSESLTLDLDGTESRFTFFDPAATVIDALSEAFGTTPVLTENAQYEGPAYDRYDWPGLALLDLTTETSEPYHYDYRIVATAPSVGSVMISTSQGIAVGDPTSTAITAKPDSQLGPQTIDGEERLFFYFDTIDAPPRDGAPVTFWVTVDATPDGVVKTIYAPSGGIEF